MKLNKTIFLLILCCVLTFASCGDTNNVDVYIGYDYTASHDSVNNILKFYSSDSGLDSFLNDFFERHSRFSSNRIHNHPVGAGGSAWKEWESLIGSWWDSSYSFNSTIPSFYATKDLVQNWLLNPKQDNQGYIWQDNGANPSSWGMGWAFPTYESSPSTCVGYEFNANNQNWIGLNGTTLTNTDTILSDDTSRELNAMGNSLSEIAAETPTIRISAFHTPFINLGWNFSNTGSAENIDDLYVYYQTQTDQVYSEDKMVKYSEFCTTGSEITGNVNYMRSYFPMYLQEKWGTSETNIITKIKFVLKANEGTKISGNMRFDFMRCEYDDRQANNLGAYITAAQSLLSFAQDPLLLAYIMPKVRMAMQHYFTLLNGENGLMSTAYYIGHDGKGEIISGTGIGNGYWDITSYPSINLYTNLMYYRSVKAMLFLEQMCETYNINSDMPSILGKDMQTVVTYNQTVESLSNLETQVKQQFRDYFWNESKGRFIGGYYGGNRNNARAIQDNGYLLYNLEAVSAGLCTTAQEKSIMQWLEGERTIAGDSSTGTDIYAFEFAPRTTTKQNIGDYVWIYSGCDWSSGVHNGGAVIQTSYYDLIARSKAKGADNSYLRLKGIQSWYEKIVAASGSGTEFYRAYYNKLAIGMQGGITGGPVGLDVEFLEAALMYAAIPTAFFGIQPGYDKTLAITPNMPSQLNYWKMENLTFGGYYYDCSIGKYFVEISGISNPYKSSTELSGYDIIVSLNKPTFSFNVLYNGAIVAYTIENEKVIVTVPFIGGKIEIVGI